MAIPKHDEIRIPAMKLIQEFGSRRVKDFVDFKLMTTTLYL